MTESLATINCLCLPGATAAHTPASHPKTHKEDSINRAKAIQMGCGTTLPVVREKRARETSIRPTANHSLSATTGSGDVETFHATTTAYNKKTNQQNSRLQLFLSLRLFLCSLYFLEQVRRKAGPVRRKIETIVQGLAGRTCCCCCCCYCRCSRHARPDDRLPKRMD